MRIPRLSLRIFALAMLLPLLLACGVSDELASEAPSERATAEPTPLETDRETLVVFYNATDGPNWEDNDSWLSDAPLGEWEGVTIDSNGRVTDLDLFENQLSGEIPSELGSLASLTLLGLGFNELSGEIPPELGGLVSLTALFLQENELSGEIPPELGNLANLKVLYLAGNQLNGCVPASLNRTDLARLYAKSRKSNG